MTEPMRLSIIYLMTRINGRQRAIWPFPPRPSPIGARLSPDNLFSSVESWSPKHLCSPLPFAKRELSVHGQLNIHLSAGMRTVPNPVESARRPAVNLASWVASFVWDSADESFDYNGNTRLRRRFVPTLTRVFAGHW